MGAPWAPGVGLRVACTAGAADIAAPTFPHALVSPISAAELPWYYPLRCPVVRLTPYSELAPNLIRAKRMARDIALDHSVMAGLIRLAAAANVSLLGSVGGAGGRALRERICMPQALQACAIEAVEACLAMRTCTSAEVQMVRQSVTATLLTGSTWPTLIFYSGLLSGADGEEAVL